MRLILLPTMITALVSTARLEADQSHTMLSAATAQGGF